MRLVDPMKFRKTPEDLKRIDERLQQLYAEHRFYFHVLTVGIVVVFCALAWALEKLLTLAGK